MSEKKNIQQTLAGFSSGFSTGTGLKLWLFFLFCFFFLGYPVPLCILLGAAGGLAGGWVIGWWNTKDQPSDLKQDLVEEPEESEESYTRVSGLRKAKQQRNAKGRNRSQGLQIPFSGFFEKGGKSSRRPRRSLAQSDKD